MQTSIPLSIPNPAGNERAYVNECLENNWIASVGPFIGRLEDQLSRLYANGGKPVHAVAVSSGSAALHLALIAAGVRPGDEVVVPALTFMATVAAARYCGAFPVVVDIEAEHWQISAASLERFFEERCTVDGEGARNRRTGRRVAAILPVHLLGHACDIDAVIAIADRFKVAVVEDAAEAVGTLYKGRQVGADGAAGCFSFNGNKIVTGGAGGAVVTTDAELAARVRYLANQAKDDPIGYVHHELGYNYRLPALNAAFAVGQMELLPVFVDRKQKIAARYRKGLADVPGIGFMREANWTTSTWWLFTVLIDPERFGRDRVEVFEALRAQGIETRPLWQPMHQSPTLGFAECMEIRVANDIHRRALSLPCSTQMTDDEVDRVIDAVKELSNPNGGKAIF